MAEIFETSALDNLAETMSAVDILESGRMKMAKITQKQCSAIKPCSR